MANTLVSLQVGVVGVRPAIFLLSSSESYAEITTEGFINIVAASAALAVEPGDFIFGTYDDFQNQTLFKPVFATNGLITLYPISGDNTGAVNLGSGAEVFKQILNGVMQFRTLVGAGGNTITEDGNQITITGPGAGGNFTWNNVTGPTATLVNNNGYISDDGGSEVTFQLPALAAFGEYYRIACAASGLWTLTQAINQNIIFGDKSTTPGLGGSLTATNIGDAIELVCIVPNIRFQVVSSIGNITVI